MTHLFHLFTSHAQNLWTSIFQWCLADSERLNIIATRQLVQRRFMNWAREIVLEITTASQRVVSAATSYARRKGSKNVQPCHFRLEKEMQKISVAARGILDVLDKASLPDGPPLDDRLEEWFSTDELPMCSDTLNQMERMLRGEPTWMGAFVGVVNALRFPPPEDKIDVAVKLFDSRKNYFYFLLTTEVW